MKTIIVFEGQNLVDIAIQEYGDVSGVFQLVADNETIPNIDHILKAGEAVLIDESKVINTDIVPYFAENNVKINTGEDFLPFAEFSDDFSEAFYI